MSTPSPPDEDLAPDRLTATLRAGGGLAAGRVVEVSVESSRTTILSTVQRLRLRYDGGAGPATVIRKVPRHDVAPDLAGSLRKEIDFYAQVDPAGRPGIPPRCYGIGGQEPGPRSLLLEDLTDSHVSVGEWPVPPTTEQCERIMDVYATWHAHWWNDPRLGATIGKWLDTSGALDRFQAEFPKRLAAVADRLGDRLAAERRSLLERLVERCPRLLGRYHTHRDLTILHGDAHVWNALHPREGTPGTIRLIDWDAWRIDTASDDLAYMMALHWYPERRRRLERRLLQRYHATLLAAGVRDYTFDALVEDYRRSVLWQVTTPIWQASWRLNAAVWWSHLERAFLAIDDLDCRALLD